MNMPNATSIVTELDKFVIGQARAKRTLASAVANHYRSISYQGPVSIDKSNVLLLGPSGSGKTFLVRTISKLLKVPFASDNATAITPPGFFGTDPEAVIRILVQNARRMIEDKSEAWKAAQRGIVYIDEIDKIANSPQQAEQSGGSKGSFSTVQIQQILLKLIEGTSVVVDGNPFPTDKVLFVASGAFVGNAGSGSMAQIVARRESGGKFVRSVDPTVLRRVQIGDFVTYGFIPEFIGRFPVVAVLDPLTEADMVAILRDAQDSVIDQARARLQADGCDLEIDDQRLLNLARMALTQGTGARGLRTLMEQLLEGPTADIRPGTLLRITVNGIEKIRLEDVASGGNGGAPSSLKGDESPPSHDGEPIPARPLQDIKGSS